MKNTASARCLQPGLHVSLVLHGASMELCGVDGMDPFVGESSQSTKVACAQIGHITAKKTRRLRRGDGCRVQDGVASVYMALQPRVECERVFQGI